MLHRFRPPKYFLGVAVKTLGSQAAASRRFAFSGTTALQSIFGTSALPAIPARFLFKLDEREMREEEGQIEWENVVATKASGSKLCLSFDGNEITARAEKGDDLFVVFVRRSSAIVIVARSGSTMQGELRWLFGTGKPIGPAFTARPFGVTNGVMSVSQRLILQELGVEG